MSVRRAIVEADLGGLNVTEFCRTHGVSRWFFYDLRRRVAEAGEAAIEPCSRAPRRVANRTPAHVEDRIVALRKELDDAGVDAGAATIAFHLEARLGPEERVPSESTIWRILSRRGFVAPQPKKAPRNSYRSFAAERANECWQIDDTGFELADGTHARIIDILDDCSRVVVASHATVRCDAEAALEAFTKGAQRWGWPQRFLSDNATVFRGTLAEAIAALGVTSGHSRPYHPQTCGKVERFHQTLKKHLHTLPTAENIDVLQIQVDAFLNYYNHTRPHRGVDRRIPAAVFEQTPKAGPDTRALTTPTTVHRTTVTANGNCSVTGRYLINLGRTHAGATATFVVTGLNAHAFIEGKLISQLTLDPNRRYQPQNPNPPST